MKTAANARGALAASQHGVNQPAMPTMTDYETNTIQVLICRYRSPCRVKNCKARATIMTRGLDAIGRATVQPELCTPHAEQVVERERRKSREIIRQT
jgi:hypothetical protein